MTTSNFSVGCCRFVVSISNADLNTTSVRQHDGDKSNRPTICNYPVANTLAPVLLVPVRLPVG